jgi:hypothetical protein
MLVHQLGHCSYPMRQRWSLEHALVEIRETGSEQEGRQYNLKGMSECF